jgi:hypothetical protein
MQAFVHRWQKCIASAVDYMKLYFFVTENSKTLSNTVILQPLSVVSEGILVNSALIEPIRTKVIVIFHCCDSVLYY